MCLVGTQYTEAFPTLEVTSRISLRTPTQIYKIIRIVHIHLHLHHELTVNCNFSDPIMPTINPYILLWCSRLIESGTAFTSDLLTSLLVQHVCPKKLLSVPQAHKPKLCLLPGLLSGALLRISMANFSGYGLNCLLPQQGLPQYSRRPLSSQVLSSILTSFKILPEMTCLWVYVYIAPLDMIAT